jgi:hypothetical protein
MRVHRNKRLILLTDTPSVYIFSATYRSASSADLCPRRKTNRGIATPRRHWCHSGPCFPRSRILHLLHLLHLPPAPPPTRAVPAPHAHAVPTPHSHAVPALSRSNAIKKASSCLYVAGVVRKLEYLRRNKLGGSIVCVMVGSSHQSINCDLFCTCSYHGTWPQRTLPSKTASIFQRSLARSCRRTISS